MKKNHILILILVMLALIIGVIAVEFLGNRPGRRGENPYAYKIGTLADVDSTWLTWEEVRHIAIQKDTLSAICTKGENICISGKGFFMELSVTGKQLSYFSIDGIPSAMTVEAGKLYLAFTRYIAVYSLEGELLEQWEPVNGLSYITCLKITDSILFAADAGNREVLKYTTGGRLLSRFSGKNDLDSDHGFIIPSPYFELDISADGELWVANTGMHTLEHYSYNGDMIGFWTNPSYELQGFTGCCNPAHIVLMNDGTFVTSEKGLVRIKTYKPSGELISVVAPPSAFGQGNTAPDIAVTPSGLICALDFNLNTIRIFKAKGE